MFTTVSANRRPMVRELGTKKMRCASRRAVREPARPSTADWQEPSFPWGGSRSKWNRYGKVELLLCGFVSFARRSSRSGVKRFLLDRQRVGDVILVYIGDIGDRFLP